MVGDEVGSQGQGCTEGTAAREQESQASREVLTGGSVGAVGAGTDFEAHLAERDAKIAELKEAEP